MIADGSFPSPPGPSLPSLYRRGTSWNQVGGRVDDDEWVPRISCQACGMSWGITGATIRHDCEQHSATGSRGSSGTAGAPGRLVHVSEILALARGDVSTTHGDGWNTYQGRLLDISLPSNEEREGECILTVSFDSRTRRRLRDALCGPAGYSVMGDARCSRMIVSVEPRIT